MNFAILYSKLDPAGNNIASNIEKFDNSIKINSINKDLIYENNIDKKLDGDFIIFLSKHQSSQNVPCMSVHPIGNWKSADYGGIPGKVCPSSASALKQIFLELSKIPR